MGNVHAFSGPPTPPPPTTVPAFPKPCPPESEETTARFENPGPLEEIHNKCKSKLVKMMLWKVLSFNYCYLLDVFPTCFEGARLMLTRGLSNHFQISHTINMSSITPSGYRFGATYVGTKQISPSEAYPILLGDVDPSGNLNASILHQFRPQIQAKFGAQVRVLS